MSNLDTINVGGIDYDIADAVSRAGSESALTITAYREDGDTASQSYSVVGMPINWKGVLYYTSATIAQGDAFAVGTNLVAATNIGEYLVTRTNRIRAYVGNDSKLHFTDATGADSVLPFNSGPVNSNWTRISSSSATTISEDGSYLIAITDGWIDRVNWTTAQKITVNGSDIPIFWQPLMQGDRDQGGVSQYYRAMVTITFAKLNAGDIVRGYKRGIYNEGYVAATPLIWRYTL